MLRVMVPAWVLYPVIDVFVKGFLMGRNVVRLFVGWVTDFLSAYYYQFFMGDEPVGDWCSVQRAKPSMVDYAVSGYVDVREVFDHVNWCAY